MESVRRCDNGDQRRATFGSEIRRLEGGMTHLLSLLHRWIREPR